jgi:hypothetical protein
MLLEQKGRNAAPRRPFPIGCHWHERIWYASWDAVLRQSQLPLFYVVACT